MSEALSRARRAFRERVLKNVTTLHSLNPSGFQFDVDNLSTLVAQIFRVVLPDVSKPQKLPSFRFDVFDFSIGIGEFELAIRQENGDAGRVLVHDGFLASGVADSHYAHSIILQFDFVMFRIDFHGISRKCCFAHDSSYLRSVDTSFWCVGLLYVETLSAASYFDLPRISAARNFLRPQNAFPVNAGTKGSAYARESLRCAARRVRFVRHSGIRRRYVFRNLEVEHCEVKDRNAEMIGLEECEGSGVA